MNCGPHKEEAPARDFLTIHSQTRLPLETSAIFTLVKAKSDANYKVFEWPARIGNINCGPHREEAPARDFLTIRSQTRLPLETSTIFTPVKPKSDETYNDPDDPLGLVT